jgi:hypothetical protein
MNIPQLRTEWAVQCDNCKRLIGTTTDEITATSPTLCETCHAADLEEHATSQP